VHQEQEKEQAFWSIPSGELLRELGSSTQQGLTSKEASNRLATFGKNSIAKAKKKTDLISLLASQFKSPIIIIFIFTSLLSYFLRETEDALIIISYFITKGNWPVEERLSVKLLLEKGRE
jgi:Mg2+-importing ATPase